MPSSTLDRPRTRARRSDWVVVVPGQQPAEPSGTAALTVPAETSSPIRRAAVLPAPRVHLPTGIPAALRTAVGRLMLMACLVGAAVASLVLTTSQDPLLALGLKTPQFVAYQGTSAENVRFVMNDGWSQMAAVPGALLMDWREGRPESALRLTMGNPAAEPMVEQFTADGKGIEAIRYQAAWPGIDVVIKTMPGGSSSNLIVEPGVDPGVIDMEYVGATALKIDSAGRLHVQGPSGEWVDGSPESWQDGPTGREPVESSFTLLGGNRFGFSVGSYDPSRPLVVDPPSQRVN